MMVLMEIAASTSVDSVGDQNPVIKQRDIVHLEVYLYYIFHIISIWQITVVARPPIKMIELRSKH